MIKKKQIKNYKKLIFLLLLGLGFVTNSIFAQGPKSPEAASFEPVDATDMVNLITGQYSYVLPLLNVPSPEGGYPIALSYHAGIALEQDASWTGLGWNVNPGAIDRSINGYPDDYNASLLSEYFWDKTRTETRYTASIGYSCGVTSVGLGFNWGSNQALGGYVSVGVGVKLEGGGSVGADLTVGTDGASIGIGITTNGGLTLGASYDSNGDVGINAGYDNNGQGFSIGYNTNGTTTLSISANTGNDNKASLDISLSSSGVGISGGVTNKTKNKTDGGAGVGMFVSFNNSVSVGDYATSTSSWMIPIMIPTPIGIFSASFGKQEFKYWMGKNVENFVTGPIYFKNYRKNITGSRSEVIGGELVTKEYIRGMSFMDINEISIYENELSSKTEVSTNNITFPGYDKFSVSAQGISGSMSAVLRKNGALFGLDGKENKEGYALRYPTNNYNISVIPNLKFNLYSTHQFEFDNEITSYLKVDPALFNNSTTASNILNYYDSGVVTNDQPRRQTSNFIEYFTNYDIVNNYNYLKEINGFLLPSVSGFDRNKTPSNGIGAFKVTAIDGKTYHYSLPVYNHEVITRTYGVIEDSPTESESYFEKRQLEAFATHWLLTAVTGPDYIDNGDGVAGDGDLGYWTSFEYGKWTEAFVWKNPYKKETFFDENSPERKTWIRGRKELYYLDKIKTRTHTALFIKGLRQDAASPEWSYNSADHLDDKENNEVVNGRFVVPSQNQLRLEKIILLKNIENTVDKAYGADTNQSVYIKYNRSIVKENLEAKYNIYDNVLDTGDNWSSCIPKAVKVIDFDYDYSLSTRNCLKLKSVNFKGKSGTTVIPPYQFDYYDGKFSTSDRNDGWGYFTDDAKDLSLKTITTPQGGTIGIEYEYNKCKSLVTNKLEFSDRNPVLFKCSRPTYTSITDLTNKTVIIEIGNSNSYPNLLNKKVTVSSYDATCFNNLFYFFRYNSTGTITHDLGAGKYKVTFDANAYLGRSSSLSNSLSGVFGCDMAAVNRAIAYSGDDFYYHNIKVTLALTPNDVFKSGGIRTSRISISDGANKYFTDYKYGQNEDGIGFISYVPFAQNIAKELPYSSELPAPRVMYEYVTMSSHKEGVEPLAKMKYRFNIMKEKSSDKIKYGSFYEILKTNNTSFTNTSQNKTVDINTFTIKENFAALGQLLEVSTVNSENQLLSKVYSTYYNMDELPNNMGITQESYQSYKEIDYTDNSNTLDRWIVNSTTRIKYPSIIKSSTEQKNGYTYTTLFNDYDLISGVSKEQVFTSSDGKTFKTKIIPAFHKYPEMGSKSVGITSYKNMLSQTAAEYSYILDEGDWKVTGVGITTWSNIWTYKTIEGNSVTPTNNQENIWRKHKTFIWNGILDSNGIFTNYNIATDDGFYWSGIGGTKWRQTSEVTLYDHYSAPLEIKDINNNFASTKMGDNDSKVIATGNASYNEMYYSSAEYITSNSSYFDGQIKSNGHLVVGDVGAGSAHTGKSIVRIGQNQNAFEVTLPLNSVRTGIKSKFKVSVWARKGTENNARIKIGNSIQNFNTSETIKADNWVLLNGYIDILTSTTTVSIVSVSGEIDLDDFRLYPMASSITGYVYNEWDELSYIVGNNGLGTHFKYDAAGRLEETYTEVADFSGEGSGGFKPISKNTYHYKN